MPLQLLEIRSNISRISLASTENRVYFTRSPKGENIELGYYDFSSGNSQIFQHLSRPEGANEMVWLGSHLNIWQGYERKSILYPFPENTSQPIPFIFHVRVICPKYYLGQCSGQEDETFFMRFDIEKAIFERIEVPSERGILLGNQQFALFYSIKDEEVIWEGWNMDTQQIVWKKSTRAICKELGIDTFQGTHPVREIIHDQFCFLALREHGLICLDWKTGSIVWYQPEAHQQIRLYKDRLVQSDVLHYKEFSINNGQMLSKHDMRTPSHAIGMTRPANNLFGITDQYIVRPDLRHGMIALFRRENGQLDDHFQLKPKGRTRFSRDFGVAEDRVWILDQNGEFYCFGVS